APLSALQRMAVPTPATQGPLCPPCSAMATRMLGYSLSSTPFPDVRRSTRCPHRENLMPRRHPAARLAALLFLALGAASASSATLPAYRSESEFAQALSRWRDEAQKLQRESRREAVAGTMAAPSPAAPAAQALAKSADAATAAESSITNVQTAGVDE